MTMMIRPLQIKKQTYVSESTYSEDTLTTAASIKVMTYNMENVQGQTAKATALVMFLK